MGKENDTAPDTKLADMARVIGEIAENGTESVTPPASATPEPAPAATPPPAAPAAAAEPAPAPAAAPTPTPDGILSKDGKHVLPYDALEQARREASLTKQENAALQAKLAEFEQAREQVASGQIPEIPDLSALKATVPEEVWNPIEAMRAAVVAQVSALAESNRQLAADLQARQQEAEQAKLDALAGTYSQTIDKFPLLKQLEQIGGPRYAQAKDIADRLLAANPNVSQEQHFTEVETELRRVATEEAKLFGLAPVAPPAAAAPAPPAPAAQPAAKPLPALVPPIPASLSDIPGGTPPAVSEAEGFANMNEIDQIATLMNAKKQGDVAYTRTLSRVYR